LGAPPLFKQKLRVWSVYGRRSWSCIAKINFRLKFFGLEGEVLPKTSSSKKKTSRWSLCFLHTSVVLNTFAVHPWYWTLFPYKVRLIVSTTTITRTQQKNHIAVKFDVGHGGPYREYDEGQIYVTIKYIDHSYC
jgi:hypothetical protein